MAEKNVTGNWSKLSIDALLLSHRLGAAIVAPSCSVLHVNSWLCDFLEAPSEQLIGRSVEEFLPEAFRAGLRRMIGEADEDFPFCGPVTKWLQPRQGDPLPVQLSVLWLGWDGDDKRLLVIFNPTGNASAVSQLEDLGRVFFDLPDAVALVNPDRTIAMVNPAVSRIFGYDPKELIGQNTSILYESEAEFARQGELRYKMESDGKSAIYLSRFKRKNGEVFPGEIIGGPVRNHRNTVIGFLGIVRDAGDRLNAERLSELFADQLTEAVEGMEEAFALFDKDDRLVTFNSKYRGLFRDDGTVMRAGVTFEEILREGVARGFYAKEEQNSEAWIQQRLEQHRKADGTPVLQQFSDGRWVQGRERLTKHGNIVGVRTDVTARMNAEKQARNRERELQLLTDSLPFPVTRVDLNGVVTFCNAAAAAWSARPRSMMVGRSIVSIVGDENYGKMLSNIRRARTGKAQLYNLTISYPDGVVRTVEVEHIPDWEDDGSMTGILTLTRDVTQTIRRESTLDTLHELVNTRQLEFDSKIKRIIALGKNYFGLSTGVLGTVENDVIKIQFADTQRGLIKVGDSFPLPEETKESFLDVAVFSNDGLSGYGGASTRPTFIPDEAVAYVGCPIHIDGNLFGFVFWIGLTAANQHYVAADLTVARQFAEWIGIELARHNDIQEMQRMQNELYRLATTDELTGLNNRRHFLTLGDREYRKALRHSRALCVALFDADFFKRINDTHGHDTGDAVLRDLAKAAVDTLRETDIVGRIGGEEFAVLLPETDLEVAVVVLDRLRERLSERHSEVGGTHVTCTISIGVARLNLGKDENLELAMSRADQALYEAKDSGRNRVVAHSGKST